MPITRESRRFSENMEKAFLMIDLQSRGEGNEFISYRPLNVWRRSRLMLIKWLHLTFDHSNEESLRRKRDLHMKIQNALNKMLIDLLLVFSHNELF